MTEFLQGTTPDRYRRGGASAGGHHGTAAAAPMGVSDRRGHGPGDRSDFAVPMRRGTALFVKADLPRGRLCALWWREQCRPCRAGRHKSSLEQCAIPLHELTTNSGNGRLGVDLTRVFWCLKYQVTRDAGKRRAPSSISLSFFF